MEIHDLDPSQIPDAGPFPSCRKIDLKEIALFFCDEGLSPTQQKHLALALDSWPPSFLKKLAPGGRLDVIALTSQEARGYSPPLRQDGASLLRPGQLVIVGADRLNDDPLTFRILLDPLQQRLGTPPQEPDAPTVRRGPDFLIPYDARLAAHQVVKRFVTTGFQYHPSDIFHAELGLMQSVGEPGESTHRVRLLSTNPAFNRWVYDFFVNPVVPFDTHLQIYAGFFATAATKPFGLVGILSWGVDAELTTIGGYEVFLDSNLQHRVRSSEDLPADKIALENTLRFQSPDRRFALGLSAATTPPPDLATKISLTGSFASD